MNQNLFELIDRFLDNEMSELERSTFHEKLKNDPVLLREVKLQSELRNAIKIKSIEPLKKKLDAIRKKVRTEEKKKESSSKKKEPRVIPLFFRISVAAILLFLVGFFGKHFLFNQNIPDGYTLVASKQVNPDYISATRSIILKDMPAVETRIFKSELTSTEKESYTFRNSQLDIYVSNEVNFPSKNISLIYFNDENEKLLLYVKNNGKLFKVIENQAMSPLLEEVNQDVKSRILNN